MTPRTFARALVALLLLQSVPLALQAQNHDDTHDGSIANHELHLFDAADFGIDPEEVDYSEDIAPILQRSCVSCHREGGGAPMSLTSYEEVEPWAQMIRYRTAIRDRMGAMPPFFVEKHIGITQFKNDPSLSDEELARIQAWVDNGAPEGDPADLPPPVEFAEEGEWTIGEPDLVLRSPEVTRPAVGPDWWGDLGLVPTGLTEDRYVQAVEVREVNDIPADAESSTVGGRYIFHHMTYTSGVLGEGGELVDESGRWPIHEVGRNPDFFPEKYAPILEANSALHLGAAHLHSNGRETTAQLEFGFKFYPEGYEPEYERAGWLLGNGIDIDVVPNKANQEVHNFRVLDEHTKIVAFEPHLHAPGARMCIEAIWGHNHFTLNCVGYDHNWVKQYVYEDDYAPLLPKGTILHVFGFLDTTPANPNLADTRNWAGGGRRSVSNMFIDLGYSVELTEEQFQAEMAERRERMENRNQYDVGCPLCWAPAVSSDEEATADGGEE